MDQSREKWDRMGFIEERDLKVPLEGYMEIRNWKSGKIGQILSGGRQEKKKKANLELSLRELKMEYFGETPQMCFRSHR